MDPRKAVNWLGAVERNQVMQTAFEAALLDDPILIHMVRILADEIPGIGRQGALELIARIGWAITKIEHES